MWTTAFRRVGQLATATLCGVATVATVATVPATAATTAAGAGAGLDPDARGTDATPQETYRESFERGFGGWLPDTDGRARRWLISRTTGRAVDGSYSLAYFLDGTNDDGTIWIERALPARPYADLTVQVSFWLHSAGASVTSWPVVGVAGVRDPETEQDLPIVGRADQQAGWTPYSFTTKVQTGPSQVLWVAVGISATWEVVRTYHVDLVEVTVEPVGARWPWPGPGRAP
jgi:hypothetical protein